MMKKQLWEASTWISEACICILSVEPIYTETAQLQMWRRILRNTLEKCIPVTLKDCAQYNWFGIKAGRFLRLIAPLM